MARITRKQQKIFAENATNNGVFGSLQANDPTISSDPDTIQSRSAYGNGWNDATYSADLLPPLEEFQALQYLFSRQLSYIFQEGVPEWDTNTTYYKGSMVKAIQSDGSYILYASLIDNNTGNLVTDTTKWVITNTSTNFHQGIPNWRADVIYSEGDWVKSYDSGAGWTIYESLADNNLNNAVTNSTYWMAKPFTRESPLFQCAWFDHEVSDASWLRADDFSWHDGTVYTNAYTHLADDIDGKTTQTETVEGITITYYLADDGHKICPASQESNLTSLYNTSGVAWYYILDTTNQRFKLPRTKALFTGLRDTVGKYVRSGLPNITGTVGAIQTDWGGASGSGALYISASSAGYNATSAYGQKGNISIDASRSNGIYGRTSASVQPTATQMYLYFYVGQFSQTAIEQTAGITTAQLNAKVDLDSSWGFPSASYDDLTLGASGAEYTAPENGWFCLSKNSSNSQQGIEIINISAGNLSSAGISSGSGQTLKVFMPVKKGDKVAVGYNANGSTKMFRFVYAQKTN